MPITFRSFKPFSLKPLYPLCCGGLVFAFLMVWSSTVLAKDLSGRLGVGFADQFYTNSSLIRLPSLSAKYALTKDLAFSGQVGLRTEKDNTGMTLGAKVFKNIFYETNLNFYGAGAVAFVKETKSGVEFQGLFGMEAFIPGLDSLGLSFETGLALTNVSGSFVLRTLGYTFLNAGVHFYF